MLNNCSSSSTWLSLMLSTLLHELLMHQVLSGHILYMSCLLAAYSDAWKAALKTYATVHMSCHQTRVKRHICCLHSYFSTSQAGSEYMPATLRTELAYARAALTNISGFLKPSHRRIRSVLKSFYKPKAACATGQQGLLCRRYRGAS